MKEIITSKITISDFTSKLNKPNNHEKKIIIILLQKVQSVKLPFNSAEANFLQVYVSNEIIKVGGSGF